jgi:dolichol-phosphate mannosyltransferase
LKQSSLRYEIIAVDDGSRDNSAAILKRHVAEIPELKIVRLRRNSGQTAAIMAGLDRARGEVIVTLDADLQNDPDDISKLVTKLNEGYDVVSGWRKDRHDHALRRNFLSHVANRLISRVTGIYLHDYGCTLKAYRRNIIQDVRLYGEMHRFIPIYAHWLGARVTEIEVTHHPRRFGQSKYGLGRVIKVILDLFVIVFLDRYFVNPIYLFGSIGLGMLGLSLIVFLWMVGLRVFEGTSFISTPLPSLAAVLGVVGTIALLLGLLAEIVMRTYFESQGRRAYLVGELVNFDRDA